MDPAATRMKPLQLTAAFAVVMAAIIVASNVLVQYPLGNWLTWGALTYPFSFLVVDLANRYHGPRIARQVVYAGFIVALVLSAWLATPRIAIASGTAFLCAELLDVTVFNRLRRLAWWKPPLVSTLAASVLDTAIFFSFAFAGTDVPWVTLAIGDFAVKVAIALFALLPFRLALALVRPAS
jgi:uncharacterized PurR-regulated membrane protein YhhQ (DUF165 family)